MKAIFQEQLEPVRNQVEIATKFGQDIHDGKSWGLDSRPQTIRRAVEGSLRRLRTDHIDIWHTIPRFNDPENLAKNRTLAEVVKAFALNMMIYPAQVSLSWLLHRKPWIVPIPGTKNPCRLQQNMSAAYIDFSDEDIARLTEISDSNTVYGGRYAREMKKMTGK